MATQTWQRWSEMYARRRPSLPLPSRPGNFEDLWKKTLWEEVRPADLGRAARRGMPTQSSLRQEPIHQTSDPAPRLNLTQSLEHPAALSPPLSLLAKKGSSKRPLRSLGVE